MFTRDVGSLFGGLPNRFEAPNAWSAVSNKDNPVRAWVRLSAEGAPRSLAGTSDPDANIHHWAWGLAMGSDFGFLAGRVINTGRELTQFNWDWKNTWSDINSGNRGAGLGCHFRYIGLHDVTQAWNYHMLDRWF